MTGAKLFVFATTHQTMQAEAAAEATGRQGILVLKPKALAGGCGLALEVPLGDSQALLLLLRERGLDPVGVYDRFDRKRWEPAD